MLFWRPKARGQLAQHVAQHEGACERSEIRSRYASVHIGPPRTFVAHARNADGCSAEFKMHGVKVDGIRRLDAHGRHVSAFTGPPVPERIRIEVAHGTAACRRALATNDLAVCASIVWDQADAGRDFECECACGMRVRVRVRERA